VLASTNVICGRFPKDSLITSPESIVVFTEIEGCLSDPSNTINIEFESIPEEPALIDPIDQLCEEIPITLNANLPNGSMGTWTASEGDILIDEPFNNSTLASDFALGENEIIWSLENEACGVYSMDTLLVFLSSAAIANPDSINVGFNSDFVIDPLANDQVPESFFINIINQSEGLDVEVSDSGNRILGETSSDIFDQAMIEYELCGIGCEDFCSSTTIIINIDEVTDCSPTTLITPNGDGINDTFLIPCIGANDFPNNQLILFNQWGDEVFNAEPYLNNWQGTYEGEALPVGTYYYIFDLGEGSDLISGFIVIEL